MIKRFSAWTKLGGACFAAWFVAVVILGVNLSDQNNRVNDMKKIINSGVDDG